MSLEDRILEDMKSALKSGRKDELNTIRMLRSQLKDARINKKSDLNDQDVIDILLNARKKRVEAIEMFKSGNRPDLVEKEQTELEIIRKYLPEQMSEEEIRQLIDEKISSLNLNSEKDIGQLMGAIMPEVKGKADGKVVQQLAGQALSESIK